MRALDLGCGPGRHAVYLASRGFDAYASDFTEEAVMLCRQALAEGGLKGEVQVADMARLPYPGAFFDLIVAYNVVYHTTRAGMKDVLAGLSRILKPGGSLLVTLKTPEEWVFGRGKEIEPDTFLREGKGVPIHFAREEEISDLLSPFEITSKEYHRRTKQIPGRGQRTHARWMIVARKPR
jgi:SAM-dependent methyltransferase